MYVFSCAAPTQHARSHRRGRTERVLGGLLALGLLVPASGCGSEERPDAASAYRDAVEALSDAGTGSYSFVTEADGMQLVRTDGTWQLSPQRHRSATTLSDGTGEEDGSATVTRVVDASQVWTLPAAHAGKDDCWRVTTSDEPASGIPAPLHLVLNGKGTEWDGERDDVIKATGPVSAMLRTLGEVTESVSDPAADTQVGFTLLLDDGRVSALRTDLGSVLRAAEKGGSTIPEALAPLASEQVEIPMLASFSDLGEAVDTAPPARTKVRTCKA